MGKLTNKIAVVTGGSAGIGQGIAARFVAEGARVFITGRIPDARRCSSRNWWEPVGSGPTSR
jgi:NAD(P)-dependent dehydrogenase (short-subunit alcohol dehydrogenase family)